MPINKPEENLLNAGLIFMFTVWLQGQMSDLILFKKNSHLVANLSTARKILPEFLELKVGCWEKQFGSVKPHWVGKLVDLLRAGKLGRRSACHRLPPALICSSN